MFEKKMGTLCAQRMHSSGSGQKFPVTSVKRLVKPPT